MKLRKKSSHLWLTFSPNSPNTWLINLSSRLLITLLYEFLFDFHFQNIRVMAKYYNRITLQRMSVLLDLPAQVFHKLIRNQNIVFCPN